MSYAVDTSVPVERTRAEIEGLLMRRGAERFAYMADGNSAAIGFVLRNRNVRFLLPLPDRNAKDFWFTPSRKNKRSESEAYKEWEQACRSRWRALYLCIKAKLEAVEIGITSFDEEFLAHFVLNDGRTVGQVVISQLDQAASGAKQLLLGPPTNDERGRNQT